MYCNVWMSRLDYVACQIRKTDLQLAPSWVLIVTSFGVETQGNLQ